MKISNNTILKSVFALKRNFSKGISPSRKVFDGIEIAPFKYAANASVSISADFELGWAWRAGYPEETTEKGKTARRNIPYLLKLFEEYNIPITWATIGHLFLESCEKRNSRMPHPDMPRPPRNNLWKDDWYIHDPCTDFQTDPFWYAPDLIQQILENNVAHEIGTHSFSHIDFSPEYSSGELVRKEIEECEKVMRAYGLKPRSLVFPYNRMGYSYLDLLSELGIIAVRHRDEKVKLSYPERTKSGTYKIYESMNLRSPKYYDYMDKARIFIEEAIKRSAVYHLWFHPSDPTEVFMNEFKRILEYINYERKRGSLWVATMQELAAYCEAREKTKLVVERKRSEINIMIENSLDEQKYGSPEISIVISNEVTPKVALLEFNNSRENIKPKNIFFKNNPKHLVVNIPVKAKSLKLIFD